MWQDFHFLRPEWFWLLIPAALLIWALIRFTRKSGGWQNVIAPHLMNTMLPGTTQSATKNSFILLSALIMLIGIIAGAGPTKERLPQPVFSVDQGHVVVIDMSLSMRATDITPDRLTRAKFKAIDLLKAINEGEMGLVAYAGDGFVISPLTEDIATLETLLPSLRPEIMPIAGSDALSGLEIAQELLLQAGYPAGQLYWITDGIEPSDVSDIREWLSATQLTVNILAVGTEEGAPVQQLSGELLKDSRGNIVIPKLNANRLLPLAKQSGGNISLLTPDDTDIQSLLASSLDIQAKNSAEEELLLGGDQWFELGPYLVVFMLPLCVYLFRKGVVAAVLIGVCLPLLSPSPVYAQSDWRNWFKNADQQGLDAYNQEQFGQAADTFADPMWRGSAQYKEGNYEAAMEEFAKVDSAQSWYNRGNTLAQMQNLDSAIAAYEEALARQSDFTQAAENKALLEELKKQQEQQSEQNQEQQDQQEQDQQNQDQNQQQDQSSQQDQQNQQQNQDNQQNQQQNQDPQQSEQESEEQNQQDEQQGETPEAEQEQQQSESEQQEQTAGEQEQEQPQPVEAEMTDEEREKQQQMEALMRRIPDDPAFLLQRKMQLEAQKRNTRRLPAGQEKTW